MTKFSAALEAIFLMLIGLVSFSAMNIVIRILSETMPPMQMVFLRNVWSLLIVVTWGAILQRRLPHFPTTRLRGHFWRATIGTVAMELWFYAVTLMPLDMATALSFSTPIFSTIFAIIFLRERAGIRRWSAILIGFIGMLLILRPGSGDVGWQAMFVIGASIMMAMAAIMVKSLTRTEPPETIVFYMALFMIPWSLGPALPHWHAFTAHQLWLAFWVAFFSTFAHLLMARAYIRADMVMLMPFDFTRLIFTAIMAYALFGETLDNYTIAGSLIIVASSVYIAHREARAKQLITIDEVEL